MKHLWMSLIILELLALLVFCVPVLALPSLCILGLAALILGLKKPELLLALIFGELIIGSMGRMIAYGSLSVRMVLFVALILSLIITRPKELFTTIRATPTSLIIVFSTVFLGIIVGILRGNTLGNIIADANNFGFILLYYPCVILSQKVKPHLKSMVSAASTMLSVKVLGLFYYFSHEPVVQGTWVYRYIRDTRVAEITAIAPYIPRVFLQSQMMLGAMLLLEQRTTWFAVVILSLSRSVYLGLLGGLLVLGKGSLRFIRPMILALVLIMIVFYAPPFITKEPITRLFSSRIEHGLEEKAVLSRYEQLPILYREIKKSPIIGQGLGTVIGGKSAFEWSYLDAWLKMGIFGIIASVSFLWFFWNKLSAKGRAVPVYSAVTHIFTPFLFHPLGIGALLLALLFEGDAS